MRYVVVVRHEDGEARLDCQSLDEARSVRQSFVNWGRCQEVLIEMVDGNFTNADDVVSNTGVSLDRAKEILHSINLLKRIKID